MRQWRSVVVGPRARDPQSSVGASDRSSAVPLLTALPPRSDAGRIGHLDPGRATPRSIDAVDTLRYDALGAKPASVSKHRRTILGDVFVEQDSRLVIAQEPRRRGFAFEEREITKIPAIVLDQIEGIQLYAPPLCGAARRNVTGHQALAPPPRHRS
jgi:hypothetical protein